MNESLDHENLLEEELKTFADVAGDEVKPDI